MEGIYGRRRYLGGVKKFKECNRFSKEIQERDKRKRNIMSREEEEKAEGS